MKRLSFVAALTLSTMLSACGGGGGGHSFIPPSTLPDNPDNPSVTCEGVTCMTNDGLSNKVKREELYSKATGGKSRMMMFARNAGNPIDEAFSDMNTHLVENAIDENKAESLRPYLILAGFEDLPENEQDLIDWIANRKYMIKRHAEKMYKMYGTEKSVYLDNAKLHLVEETAHQDGFINFITDPNTHDITDIEISENDFGAEALSDKLSKTGENTFAGNDKLHIYELPYDSNGSRLYIEISGYDENGNDEKGNKLSLDFIKEKLQLKLEERIAENLLTGDDSLLNMKDTISKKIGDLTDADLTDTTIIEHEILDRKIDTVYTSYAKNLKNGSGNLLYSDFGLIKWDETRTGADPDDIEKIHANKVFAGGYDTMKVDPTKFASLEFTGDAVGGVNYKKIIDGDYGIVESNTLQLDGGKATLKFANGEEKLNVTFNNWYDVDVTKNLNTNTGSISFSGGDKIDDNRFKFTGLASNNIDGVKGNGPQNFDGFDKYENTDFIKEAWDKNSEGYTGAMDMGYYGKDGVPSEATGYVMYHEESLTNGEKIEVDDRKNPGHKIEKDLINVLEMQIGVGMQKK